jgi:hypothetical protein
MNAKIRVEEAKREGRIWLGGEMEIPLNSTPQQAYEIAANIAEACGYLVGFCRGHSAIEISGGEIPGYAVLDWFSPDAKRPKKLELWSAQEAWFE